MGRLFFWMGLGAAQVASASEEGKPAGRRHQIISLVIGILVAVLIAAVLFGMLAIDQ